METFYMPKNDNDVELKLIKTDCLTLHYETQFTQAYWPNKDVTPSNLRVRKLRVVLSVPPTSLMKPLHDLLLGDMANPWLQFQPTKTLGDIVNCVVIENNQSRAERVRLFMHGTALPPHNGARLAIRVEDELDGLYFFCIYYILPGNLNADLYKFVAPLAFPILKDFTS